MESSTLIFKVVEYKKYSIMIQVEMCIFITFLGVGTLNVN